MTRLSRRGSLAAVVGTILLLASGAPTISVADSTEGTSLRTNPVLGTSGGVRNVTFYYDGTTPLEPGADLSKLGRPAVVVATGRDGDRDPAAAIHSIGARAYKYLQLYWAPHNTEYEGINFKEHPGWAFCRNGSTRRLGRITNGGEQKWFFIDSNEKAVRARIKEVLAGIKTDGWDGVMFDRGIAATQYATDYHGAYNWNRRSTCTGSPYERGATLSDAYVNMLGLAEGVGLEAMMNSGRSPYDPRAPMRPDPEDPDCKTGSSARCGTITDAWSHLNLVVNETAAKPKDKWWKRTFSGNLRSERHARQGRRTVALVTTSSLGGNEFQTRPRVFYAWSRIKLFDLAVAVNTGDDGCPGSTDVCNRHGMYPSLVNTVFGTPLENRPRSRGCLEGSAVRCLWTRSYARGMNVLNATPSPRADAGLTLRTPSCRYVYDVYNQTPLAGNRCVSSVRLDLPAWSGRPLRYSTSPWATAQ